MATAVLLSLPVGVALAGPPDVTPYRVGGEVSTPVKISGAAPVYTEEARRARVTGVVILEAVIDAGGNVTETKVLKGLPMGLDRAAAEAVQSWKFSPARLNDKAVPVHYILTVNFTVEDDPPPGPRLRALLGKEADFAALVRDERYREAAALLDDWERNPPAKEGASLARVYLLVKQGKLEDAMKLARSAKGDDSYEMFYLVGAYALSEASTSHEVSRRERISVADLGLRAETLALSAKPDGLEAMSTKVSLLDMMYRMSSDPEQRQQLLDERNQLKAKLAALRPQG